YRHRRSPRPGARQRAAVRDHRTARGGGAARRRHALRALRQLAGGDRGVLPAGHRLRFAQVECAMNQAAASRLQLLAWCLLAAFPLLALTGDKAGSVICALFVIAGLVILVRRDWPPLHRESRWVLLAFAAYFLASLASFLLGEQTRLGEKILGRDARFLLALPLFFALLKTGFAERWLKLAVAAGGMFTGAWAIGEVIIAGDFSHRASGESISIVFGHLSALLFALNLALLLRGNRQERWLAALGAVFALVAVTFSGTRGALLSVIAAAASGMLMLAWQGRAHRRLVT